MDVNQVEFNLSPLAGRPSFTIAAPVQGVGRYIRQTRCPSDVGVVSLLLEPYVGEKHFTVEWSIGENVIPGRFMPAVVEGIKAGLEQFTQQGLLVNVKVTVVDGLYHEIDSWDRSYRVAARLAFEDALSKATLIEIPPPIDKGAI